MDDSWTSANMTVRGSTKFIGRARLHAIHIPCTLRLALPEAAAFLTALHVPMLSRHMLLYVLGITHVLVCMEVTCPKPAWAPHWRLL